MKHTLSSFLKKCEATKNISTLPKTKGIYLISNCPLTNEDPPKWTCDILEKGVAESLKSTITNIVINNGLSKQYQYLSYYYMLESDRAVYRDFLSEIDQDHT